MSIYEASMDIWGDQSYERLLYPLLQYNESVYTPPTYIPTQIVSDVGRPNVLDGVIDGNEKATRDYVIGVLIGSLLIAIVAIVWFIAIISLKCAGSKSVGFLCGHFVRPYTTGTEKEEDHGVEIVLEGKDNDDQHVSNTHEPEQERTSGNESAAAAATHADPIMKKNFEIRVRLVRVIFLLSGISVIISGKIHSSFLGNFYLRIIAFSFRSSIIPGGLFYGKGAITFRDALYEVQYGIDVIQDIGEKAMKLAENVTATANDVADQVQPDVGEEPICGLDSELSTRIRSLYTELTANIDSLKSTLVENIGSISRDVQNGLNELKVMEKYIGLSAKFFNGLITMTSVLITLIVLMMAGVILSMKGVSNRFTRCIPCALRVPVFTIFLIMSWIFATLFLATGLAGSDFCLDPDKYVEGFLYAHEDMFSGMLFGFLVYYVTVCCPFHETCKVRKSTKPLD